MVTTDAYIPGELFFWTSSEVKHSTLLEIAYAEDNVTADLLPRWRILDFAFQLPASSPDGGSRSFEAAFFQSDATGVWRFESEEVFPHCDREKNFFCSYGVTGVNGVWTRVPAPSTLVLLGVGLAVWSSLAVAGEVGPKTPDDASSELGALRATRYPPGSR